MYIKLFLRQRWRIWRVHVQSLWKLDWISKNETRRLWNQLYLSWRTQSRRVCRHCQNTGRVKLSFLWYLHVAFTGKPVIWSKMNDVTAVEVLSLIPGKPFLEILDQPFEIDSETLPHFADDLFRCSDEIVLAVIKSSPFMLQIPNIRFFTPVGQAIWHGKSNLISDFPGIETLEGSVFQWVISSPKERLEEIFRIRKL